MKISAAVLLVAACLVLSVSAQRSSPRRRPPPRGSATITDWDILNFALNLEYLEANFYSCAAYGKPLSAKDRGNGPAPTGCKRAQLSPEASEIAAAIAEDEIAHVRFIRAALGAAAVPQPEIDIGMAFEAAANAAFGLNATNALNPAFDAYANDILFYHAAFIFEDVGVTAYKFAAPLVESKAYLSAAAGILAVEAYHGGAIRAKLLEIQDLTVFPYATKVSAIVDAISALRAAVSGAADDKGIVTSEGNYVLAPADANAVAFGRSPAQVLKIVYLGGTTSGGFFPKGLNGLIK